jgi:hypothetical protein
VRARGLAKDGALERIAGMVLRLAGFERRKQPRT